MAQKLYIFIIFLSVLASMNAWFFLFMKNGILFFFLSLITIIFITQNRTLFNRTSKNRSLFILIIIAYLIGSRSIDSWRWCVITFPALTLLFARNDLLLNVLKLTSKWLAILLIPGIILHFLNFIHPLSPIGPNIYLDYYGNYNNFILYIKAIEYIEYYFRFSSIFIEPGHLGMILSYYLFALKYDYKNIIVWIFTIALLLTLSLAGYVLFIGGLILYSISINLKTTIKYLVCGSISIYLLMFVLTLVLDDFYIDYVKSATIERLEFDDDKGIKGNNRNNENADVAFETLATSASVLWGLGNDKFYKDVQKKNIISAGYKTFILNYGLISLFLIGYVYFKISKKKKVTFCFFILICMSFLQRAYPFWSSWLVPYICFCLNNDWTKYNKSHITSKVLLNKPNNHTDDNSSSLGRTNI